MIRSRLLDLGQKVAFSRAGLEAPEQLFEKLMEWGVPEDTGEPWKAFVLGVADRLNDGIVPLRQNLELLISSWREREPTVRYISMPVPYSA